VEGAEEEREFITRVLFNTFYKGERGIVPLGCSDDVYFEKFSNFISRSSIFPSTFFGQSKFTLNLALLQ
jgi:hypothetical protein